MILSVFLLVLILRATLPYAILAKTRKSSAATFSCLDQTSTDDEEERAEGRADRT
ncbi:hypothetical protein PUN28_020148 [Cardiocondyla obscurior]|uniref:Uncharacterized protein n=1 Tax=Cardiocondyla obscurior TaxID=286306 RepID=A0AAW2EAL1_9HYME